MSVQLAGVLCSWVAAFFAFLAAVLWVVSATVQVPFPSPESLKGPDMVVEGHSFVGTAKAQAKWSRRAALAAAVAAVFQGVALLL